MVTVKDSLTVEEEAERKTLWEKYNAQTITADELSELHAVQSKADGIVSVPDAPVIDGAGGGSTDGSLTVDAGPGKSGKTFWITRHYSYDSSPKNALSGITRTDWIALMKEMVKDIYAGGTVDFMACIFHDKDIDVKTGAHVELHFHTFVRFKGTENEKHVQALFGTSDRKNSEKVKNNLAMSMYIIHVSKEAVAENKTIYPRSKVFTFNCDYNELVKESFWKKRKNDDNELQKVDIHNAKMIVDQLGLDIRNGKISRKKALQLLEEQAGYSWVRQYGGSFAIDQEAFIKSRVSDMKKNGRNLRSIYIMGAGGIGKSSIAEVLANKMAGEFDYLVAAANGSGKTSDMYGGCTDEMVIVANELNPGMTGMSEFHSNSDPTKYAPASSRNENEDFIGHTAIYTNSLSPLRFCKDLVLYSKGGSELQDPWNRGQLNDDGLDKYWQTRRRLKNLMVLVRDKDDLDYVQLHVFNLRTGVLLEDGSENRDDGTHIHVGCVRYKAIPDTKPEITPDVVGELLRLIDVDVKGVYAGVMNIDTFLEQHNMMERVNDNVLTKFIEDVVNVCVWDLLPTKFLYQAYKSFRYEYFKKEEELSIQEFTAQMDILLVDWVWKKNIRTADKMKKDEPLIKEYKLLDWMNHAYHGDNPIVKRDFVRQPTYRGYVRK